MAFGLGAVAAVDAAGAARKNGAVVAGLAVLATDIAGKFCTDKAAVATLDTAWVGSGAEASRIAASAARLGAAARTALGSTAGAGN